jgi:hypothetical protein
MCSEKKRGWMNDHLQKCFVNKFAAFMIVLHYEFLKGRASQEGFFLRSLFARERYVEQFSSSTQE